MTQQYEIVTLLVPYDDGQLGDAVPPSQRFDWAKKLHLPGTTVLGTVDGHGPTEIAANRNEINHGDVFLDDAGVAYIQADKSDQPYIRAESESYDWFKPSEVAWPVTILHRHKP